MPIIAQSWSDTASVESTGNLAQGSRAGFLNRLDPGLQISGKFIRYMHLRIAPDCANTKICRVPVVGDVPGHTLSPIISQMMWPLMMTEFFGPRSMPAKFEGFPKEMAVRPSQIRASAAESALMIPDAFHFRNQYASLKMPVVIIAGEEDRHR